MHLKALTTPNIHQIKVIITYGQGYDSLLTSRSQSHGQVNVCLVFVYKWGAYKCCHLAVMLIGDYILIHDD